MLAVREFQSADEIFAHYASVRRRIENAAAKAIRRPVEAVQAPPAMPAPPPPSLPPVSLETLFPRIAAKRILAEAADKHGVTVEDVLGPARPHRLTLARQEAMYRLRLDMRWSLPRIGSFMNRDHSTVLHGIEQHRARLLKAAGREP